MKPHRLIAFAAAILVNFLIVRELDHSMVAQVVTDRSMQSIEEQSDIAFAP